MADAYMKGYTIGELAKRCRVSDVTIRELMDERDAETKRADKLRGLLLDLRGGIDDYWQTTDEGRAVMARFTEATKEAD